MTPVRFGVDRLVADPAILDGARRVGLVTNDAARLASDTARRSRSALLAVGVPIVRLFGPEHGLTGTAEDGAAVADGRDPATGLEVCSLYGDRLRPTREQLGDLDSVLFDIPDVGARFYTFAWTLLNLLSAAAEYGVRVVVLDRPNPLGGDLAMAEGPILDPALYSFVGGDRIPIRHSMTLGELALLWRAERFPGLDLRVVPCGGWTLGQHWPELGIPWVPTSPAMPSYESALCYPGSCFFEATNLSVGRGTAEPFQRIGAPWLAAEKVRDLLAERSLPGVRFEAELFVPSYGPYIGERCAGLRYVVEDRAVFRPVATGLWLLSAVAEANRSAFSWWRYPTAANPDGTGHLDRLVGVREVRELIDRGTMLEQADIDRLTSTERWQARAAPVMMYPA